MNLTKANQSKAEQFIMQKARDLEKGLYAFHFRSGGAEQVIRELARFQNQDGGFGNGLEPDLRIPDSSAIASVRGLQILIEIDALPDHPMLRETIAYFLKTYDSQKGVWPIIPALDCKGNQAPWWQYDADLEKRWRGFLINPTVEILGCLGSYPSQVLAALLARIKENALAYPATLTDQMTMSDILCYSYLLERKILDDHEQQSLVAGLRPIIAKNISRNPAEWKEYVLKPLWVVTSPNSPFYEMFKTEVEKNLDYELANQQADGSWLPNWAWEGAEWIKAKQEWQGILTLNLLRVFKRFNRID